MLVLGACGAGTGEGLDQNGQPLAGGGGAVPLAPTLASIQDNIFTPSCAYSGGCHQGVGQQGLSLDPGSSWGSLFNVDSAQIVTLKRVNPGMPDLSYLIHKLEGMQPGGGQIVGARMPADGLYLQQATIQVVKEWILNGALP